MDQYFGKNIAMKYHKQRLAFTITELLIVVLVVSICISLMLPAIAKTRGDSMLQESMDNLVTLSVAHVMYAADWNGRQITYVADDISIYGSVQEYNNFHDCDIDSWWEPECQPIFAGWCGDTMYAYWPSFPGHNWSLEPLGFPAGAGVDGFGNFRFVNFKALHDYVNGRFYDPTYFAPADTVPYKLVAPLFDEPCEYAGGNVPIWTTYAMSPAAMYHPDVMRSNADGGWQDPWGFVKGHASPGLFQAMYPDLKTQMIEHHWLQSPPADCNPAFEGGSFEGCEPYYFNHGIDSSPVTLFYDGHVRLLPNTEVLLADIQVLKDTGGVDGLWHRGTSFGEDGYFIQFGFDGVPLSHHILTTDGIMGRDTLGGMSPLAGQSSYFNRSGWRKSNKPPSTDDEIDKPKTNWSIELLPD